VPKMQKVYAVPNPFVVKSGFSGLGEENKIEFVGLPERATIKIYSFSGQLIETIEHDERVFSSAFLQITRNNQDLASGVYFFVVKTPDGAKTSGKFYVLK